MVTAKYYELHATDLVNVEDFQTNYFDLQHGCQLLNDEWAKWILCLFKYPTQDLTLQPFKVQTLIFSFRVLHSRNTTGRI